MQEKLKQFIKDNNLSFKEGKRNTSSTILSGYALHIGASVENCKESVNTEEFTTAVAHELERVYNYAKSNNYNKFWEQPEAKTMYKF